MSFIVSALRAESRGRDRYPRLHLEWPARCTSTHQPQSFYRRNPFIRLHFRRMSLGVTPHSDQLSQQRQAVADAHAELIRLRAVIDAGRQTVWTVSADTRDGPSPRWRGLIGVAPEDVNGGDWRAAVHPNDLAGMEKAWLEAQESTLATEVRYRLRMSGGQYRWHRARIVPQRDANGHLVEWVGIFTDIDQLVRRDDGMRFLADASVALTESLDERATLETLARLAVDNLADGCMVTLVRPDGSFEQVATRSADDNVTARYAAETERMYPLPPNASSGYPLAIRTGQPELVAESAFDQKVLPAIAADAVHLERLRKLDMYSAMVLPLVARGSTLGAITLVLHGPHRRRPFDEQDVALGTELARRAALALDNARLFEAERAARGEAANAADRVQALADASRSFADSATDPRRLMDELARIATNRIGDMCVVRLLTPDGTMLEAAAAHHARPETAQELREVTFAPPVLADAGLTGRLVRDGQPLFIPRADSQEIAAMVPEQYRAYAERHPLSSIIGVALRAEGRLLGTVMMSRESPSRPYTHDDLALVQDLADRAALVLERSRLFAAERTARAEAERSADLTRRLQEITASFARALSIEHVATTTLSHGLDALSAQSGVVFVMDSAGTAIDVVKHSGIVEKAVRPFMHVPLSASLPVTDALRAGEILYLNVPEDAASRYPEASAVGRFDNSDVWVAIPLFYDGRALGALGLGFKDRNELTTEKRTLIDALGRHCAQAMERARLIAAERRARSEAELATQVKSELLAKVSHETRQPVHATVGWIDMLDLGLHGPLTDAQREALRRIKSNQSRLLSVLNDLLDISRIQAGKLELRVRETRVVDVIDTVESAVAPLMSSKGISYEFNRPDAGVRVLADPDHLVGILTNLLSNSAKFTPRDGKVTARCHVQDTTVYISVEDTGIGIPEAMWERVFEPFFQVESGFTRTTVGTGLGLAISREAARAMGGDVTVESTMGVGSCFTVSLPRG